MRIELTELPGRDSSIRSLARRLESLLGSERRGAIATPESEIQALEQAITELPAASLTEVAIQLMLASSLIERGGEGMIEDPEEYLRCLNRLIRSALTALLRETGLDLSEFGGDRYAPGHTNPFHDSFHLH